MNTTQFKSQICTSKSPPYTSYIRSTFVKHVPSITRGKGKGKHDQGPGPSFQWIAAVRVPTSLFIHVQTSFSRTSSRTIIGSLRYPFYRTGHGRKGELLHPAYTTYIQYLLAGILQRSLFSVLASVRFTIIFTLFSSNSPSVHIPAYIALPSYFPTQIPTRHCLLICVHLNRTRQT